MATRYQVRSVSLLSKSHPSIVNIHERLNMLRSLQDLPPSTSDTLCSNLEGLAEVYARVDFFLNMESTQKVFSHCREKLWVSEVLDLSVQMLDICSSLRDAMVEVKEHVQDIRFSLRRRNGDFSIEKSICRYVCLKKRMRRSFRHMIKSLNQMVHRLKSPAVKNCADSCSGSTMVQILIQVTAATVMVYNSLLSFLSTPVVSKKMTKWSLITKMRKKKAAAAAAWEDASVNEFSSIDAMNSSKKAAQAICVDKLVSLESSAETIEKYMGRMFRNLVTLRVSLLNALSQ